MMQHPFSSRSDLSCCLVFPLLLLKGKKIKSDVSLKFFLILQSSYRFPPTRGADFWLTLAALALGAAFAFVGAAVVFLAALVDFFCSLAALEK